MNILIHFFTPTKITLEAYYQALAQADLGWHEGTNDSEPFIKYMLGIILKCYREFEERLIISEKSGNYSTESGAGSGQAKEEKGNTAMDQGQDRRAKARS